MMPHISDGDLNAWLDGALLEGSDERKAVRLHVDSCTDCADRLEEARELREAARGILASAIPNGTAPNFADIQQRATAGGADSPDSGGGRWRLGWLSAQRLGWAATVVLALGAGWIGRAVLEEKGWTDPFHEGQAPAASAVEQAPPEAGARFFADEGSSSDAEVGESVQRQDRPPEENELARKEDAVAGAEGLAAELKVGGEVDREQGPADEAAERERDAADTPRRLGALAQTEGPVEERLAEIDGIAAPAAEPGADDFRSKSVQPAGDPWHALPGERLAGDAVQAAGCYRLEFGWSPGVGYLPGTLDLTATEADDRAGQSVYGVEIPGDAQTRLHEAIWTAPSRDSIWIRLVTGDDRSAFTVRAERSGDDWTGEARVLTPGSPVSRGQTRGAVLLVRTLCQRP
ncbi:MAG: hypothetical protein KJO44_06135 [Gemmatimonadetes bacterium]|nr:hypothetical protein [Gemmatimonadota bacterium]